MIWIVMNYNAIGINSTIQRTCWLLKFEQMFQIKSKNSQFKSRKKLEQLTMGGLAGQSLKIKGGLIFEYVQKCSNPIFIQQAKLFSKILCYYSKKISYFGTDAKSKSFIEEVVQIMWQKKQKMSISWPSYLMYIMKDKKQPQTQNITNKQSTQAQNTKLNSISGKQSLTWHNYQQQSQGNMIQSNINLNYLLCQLTNFIIQPINPSCIGCSEFINLDKVQKKFEYPFCSTICENQQIPDTGQYYSVICGVDNSQLLPQLIRSMAVALGMGGGYIIVNGASGNRIHGILESSAIYETIYQKICSAVYSLQPSLSNQQVVCKKIYVSPSVLAFSMFTHFTKYEKYIIKISVMPKHPYIFYQRHCLSQNKSILNFYSQRNKQIVTVTGTEIYNQIYKRYKLERDQKGKRYPCLPCCVPMKIHTASVQTQQYEIKVEIKKEQKSSSKQEKNKEQTNETVVFDGTSEQPLLKYKSCTLITITNKKNQKKVVQPFKKQLLQKKIYATVTKPYTSYALISQRSIFAISHECDFTQLSKIQNKVDSQGKCRLVIVHKLIKVKGFLEKENWNRLKLAFKKVFDREQSQIKVENVWQKMDGINNQKPFTYILVPTLKQAVFAYIYLDNISVRCQLKKQSHYTFKY